MRQYCKVSSGTCSRISLEISPKVARTIAHRAIGATSNEVLKKPPVQPMQPTSTSLKRPARLMRRYTIATMVKINPAITLLSKLCNSRLLRVPNNLYDSTRMLNVDEGVMLVNNRSKILQRQFVLQILNARSIPRFSQATRTVFLFQNTCPTFFNNARSMSSARPTFYQNARPAFCLSQNVMPAFLILNARLALWVKLNQH